MRLGELLVKKGLIVEAQLKEALEAQLIYGGHLGTVLIELGCLTEQQLGPVLAETFGVRCVTHEMLAEVPRAVINVLPAKLAEKHTCVPFRIRDKVLDVAMLDPKNLLGTDELSFATGHRIEPWIAPEVRLFQAMERYYDIPRRLRYVTLCTKIDSARRAAVQEQQQVRLAGASSAGPAVAEPPVLAAPDTPPPAPRRVPVPPGEDALAGVSREICSAGSQTALADAVLRWVGGHAERAVLFKVKHHTAFFWRGAGFDVTPGATRFSFDVREEPIFHQLGGDPHYRGPMPADSGLWRALAISAPGEALVLPVHLDDWLVALLYADGGDEGRVGGEVHDFGRLVRKLALGLKMMIVQRKIHSI